MLFMYNVFILAALHILFEFAKGQLGPQLVRIAEQMRSTYIKIIIFFFSNQVAVGLQGSFYSPQTVSVAVNNSVTFEFYGE